jgi:uncharacterized protein YdeI (YjbR/CyaY-like superfamily)
LLKGDLALPAKTDLPVILFENPKAWAKWLSKNHNSSPGIWMRLAKKSSDLKSVTYPEAIEEALCYGWIDGQKLSYDESTWLQKFTPRRPKSIWSKINTAKAEKLIQSKRMKPAGQREIDAAKKDGRWDRAYHSFGSAEVPEDFQAALNKHSKAKAFFATLDRANRYAILFRIQTAAKAETRTKRIAQFIEMLERKEKLH